MAPGLPGVTMLVMRPERVVALSVATRRQGREPMHRRVAYELARLRVADLREPPPRLAHVRLHD